MNRQTSYYKLEKWENLIDFGLILFLLYAMVAATLIFWGGISLMWKDILINIGCSVAFTLALSIFVYYKFLKHIPDENRKQIEALLNDRLGYETTNHASTVNTIITQGNHLSIEHRDIKDCLLKSDKELNSSVTSIITKLDADALLKKERHDSLKGDYAEIHRHVEKLFGFEEIMQQLNHENEMRNAMHEKDLETIFRLEKSVHELLEKNETLQNENTRLREEQLPHYYRRKDDHDLSL